MFPPTKPLDIFSAEGGCSEGLDAFRFFLNRDPNRDKAFARSDQPRTSKTYRRQDDIFGYELRFLLSGVLPVRNIINN